jgi:hypothetical protein
LEVELGSRMKAKAGDLYVKGTEILLEVSELLQQYGGTKYSP